MELCEYYIDKEGKLRGQPGVTIITNDQEWKEYLSQFGNLVKKHQRIWLTLNSDKKTEQESE